MINDYEHLGLSPEELAELREDDEPTPEPVSEPPEPAAEPPAPPPETVPPLSLRLPEDLDAQMRAVSELKRELRSKYQEGDLEFDAYEEQRDQIDRHERRLEQLRAAAERERERTQQTMAQRWTWEQERFFADRANARLRDDAALRAGYNATLQSLAADPANEHRPMRWFLEEAARATRQKLAEALGREAHATPTRADTSPPVDRWARLDKLSGPDLEQAVAGMTDAEREEYLRS